MSLGDSSLTSPFAHDRAMINAQLALKAMSKTPDLRVRPTGSAERRPLGRQGTASWPVVPSLTPPKLFEAASRLAPDNERLVQDRAGEPADRSRDMLKSRCGHAGPSLAEHALLGAKRKRNTSLVRGQKPVRSRPAHPGPGTANGRGFAVQVQSGRSIRPCLTHRVISLHRSQQSGNTQQCGAPKNQSCLLYTSPSPRD